jgi:hypothetical protein
MNTMSQDQKYEPLIIYPQYYDRICQAERYASSLLPFIPRGLPVFQSHGLCHSETLIRYIHQVLGTLPISLNHEEIFLLFLAAWFHDIGYLHPLSIHDRSRHAEFSSLIIRTDPFLSELLTGRERNHLAFLIECHDSRVDFTSRRITSPLRMHLITDLFRLIDALDLGTDRCPPEVFSLIEDGLDEHSRRHWKAHQNVQSCFFRYPALTIMVYVPEDPFFRLRIVPHLEDDCSSCSPVFLKSGLEPCYLAIETSDGKMPEISPWRTEKKIFLATVSSHGQ